MTLALALKAAIDHAIVNEGLADRRVMLVIGSPATIDLLKLAAAGQIEDGRQAWSDPPSCFSQAPMPALAHLSPVVAGSFVGVPVASADGGPPGIAVLIGKRIVAGVSLIDDGSISGWTVHKPEARAKAKRATNIVYDSHASKR